MHTTAFQIFTNQYHVCSVFPRTIIVISVPHITHCCRPSVSISLYLSVVIILIKNANHVIGLNCPCIEFLHVDVFSEITSRSESVLRCSVISRRTKFFHKSISCVQCISQNNNSNFSPTYYTLLQALCMYISVSKCTILEINL